ncbi:hypothetical protein [Mucilaginibacter pedocola]|uniref:Uncharacterized protein n=1 Tax=Mucilaginibacter pedocola TaxID=1792845 RepID=A0A1S9PHI2_9SPHI|nr:hypothetical protein [Mucilaginibacter pedocola]OOQ60414.1 hypothetical protein BC343_25720 [Mucilaginibacter pedocola]
MGKDAVYLAVLNMRAEITRQQKEIVLTLLEEEVSLTELRGNIEKLQQLYHGMRNLISEYDDDSPSLEQYDQLLFKLDLEALLFNNDLRLNRPANFF